MTAPTSPAANWPAFAREIVEHAVRGHDAPRAAPPDDSDQPFGGVFVTLKKFGRLRGCMGTLDASRPLAETVSHAARTAALEDPRFPPVTPAEMADLTVEVSILSQPWPMSSIDELEVGKHGIVVQNGPHRGLFLPQVAVEHRLDKRTFLSRCCSEKAGLPPDAWEVAATEVQLFTADVFSEQSR